MLKADIECPPTHEFPAACRKSLFATQCRRMKFQKVVRLRTQTHAFSGRHAECCETARSMTAGNFGIFLNNPIQVSLP